MSAQCFQCILSPTPQTHFTDEYHCITLQTPPAAFPSEALISWCSATKLHPVSTQFWTLCGPGWYWFAHRGILTSYHSVLPA